MDERTRGRYASSPASAGRFQSKGHALEGRGFYVWDEDAARARSLALELGFPGETRPAGGAPRADRPGLSKP